MDFMWFLDMFNRFGWLLLVLVLERLIPIRRDTPLVSRGWISDLLAKAINKGSLDSELQGVDKAGLLKLLSSFGDVDASAHYDYHGSSRSGYAWPPNANATRATAPARARR